MSQQREQREQPTNEPSLLLGRDENEMVFAALGHRRIVSCFLFIVMLADLIYGTID